MTNWQNFYHGATAEELDDYCRRYGSVHKALREFRGQVTFTPI